MTDLATALREHIALRARRARHFDAALFGEPAWDILIDLALARIDRVDVSITDASVASGVPLTTAMRHIGLLIDAGLAARQPAPDDGRRSWLYITDDGFARIEALFCPGVAVARAA